MALNARTRPAERPASSRRQSTMERLLRSEDWYTAGGRTLRVA